MDTPQKVRAAHFSVLLLLPLLGCWLVGAGREPDKNWARIRSVPRAQRQKFADNLKRFDLELNREQQQSVRELDRRLSQLEPDEKAHRLAVLRRYHNWVQSLPENHQTELMAKPPDERMALVRKLILDHPVPGSETPFLMQMAGFGRFSPFELASVFRIWQELTPVQRRTIESLAAGPKPLERLRELAHDLQIPWSTRPSAFDESGWVAKVEAYLKEKGSIDLDDEEELAKADNPQDSQLSNPEPDRQKRPPSLRSRLRQRQAITLFFLRNPPHPVSPEKLDLFLGAFPSWLRATFDPFPPDEARRQLTIVYRLVFPYPQEWKPPQKTLEAPGAQASPPRPNSNLPQRSPGPEPPGPRPRSAGPLPKGSQPPAPASPF